MNYLFFFSGKKNQKPRRCKNSPSPHNIFLGLIASICIRFHTPLYFCLRTEIQADQGAQTIYSDRTFLEEIDFSISNKN